MPVYAQFKLGEWRLLFSSNAKQNKRIQSITNSEIAIRAKPNVLYLISKSTCNWYQFAQGQWISITCKFCTFLTYTYGKVHFSTAKHYMYHDVLSVRQCWQCTIRLKYQKSFTTYFPKRHTKPRGKRKTTQNVTSALYRINPVITRTTTFTISFNQWK